MRKFLHKMENKYEENLNLDILNKAFDKPIEEYIYQAFKSLEILPAIKILGYEYDPKGEADYDQNNYIIRRNKNKNKAIKSIAESRCSVMYIDIELKGMNKKGEFEVRQIKKPIIIPIQDDKGFYTIKGKKYYLIYQMVDKMLYPSFNAVTTKSLMPICVRIENGDFEDIDGTIHTIPTHTIQIFKNAINCLYIYSEYGITKTLMFLEVDRFISVEEDGKYDRKENRYYFPCGKKSNIVVSVDKYMFDHEIYVKSMAGCLISIFKETKMKYDEIDDYDTWMIHTGGNNTVKRGQYQHIFFNRLLDDTNREEMKINEYDKQNIRYLLRYILQNYYKLWEKDNLAMENKRLRCNEYIASFITQELSDRINKIVSMGDKAGLQEYLKLFRFSPDIFIMKLYASGVLRFAESNSDMTFMNAFKVTKKGPQSLGGKNTRRIPIRQRTLHPSMIGFIDVSAGSSSDPGQSLDLSPYNKMKSFYFDDSLYENEMHYKISQYLKEYPLGDDYVEITFNCKDEKEYNEVLDALFRAGEGKLKISGVTSNPLQIIVEEDPRLSFRKFNEDYLKDESRDKE